MSFILSSISTEKRITSFDQYHKKTINQAIDQYLKANPTDSVMVFSDDEDEEENDFPILDLYELDSSHNPCLVQEIGGIITLKPIKL